MNNFETKTHQSSSSLIPPPPFFTSRWDGDPPNRSVNQSTHVNSSSLFVGWPPFSRFLFPTPPRFPQTGLSQGVSWCWIFPFEGPLTLPPRYRRPIGYQVPIFGANHQPSGARGVGRTMSIFGLSPIPRSLIRWSVTAVQLIGGMNMLCSMQSIPEQSTNQRTWTDVPRGRDD